MFYSKKLKKLKKVKHCFFSRKKGFSKGIYKSLNCGRGSKDNKKNIQKNLTLVAKLMAVEKTKLIDELQKILEETTRVKQLERQNEEANLAQQNFDKIPFQIYVG